MISIPLIKLPCESCDGTCDVVKCPACDAVRWLHDWEVYDDFAVCPECDSVVQSYETLSVPDSLEAVSQGREPTCGPNYLMCRLRVEALAAAEVAAEVEKNSAKPKRRRKKAKQPELFTTE